MERSRGCRGSDRSLLDTDIPPGLTMRRDGRRVGSTRRRPLRYTRACAHAAHEGHGRFILLLSLRLHRLPGGKEVLCQLT